MPRPLAASAALLAVTSLAVTGCSSPSAPESTPSSSGSKSPSAGPTSSSSPSSSEGRTVTPVPTSSLKSDDPDLRGPNDEDRERAQGYVKGMSVEDRAGAVLIQEYQGTDAKAAAAKAARLKLAGTIIMGDNVPTAKDGKADVEAMKQDIADLRAETDKRPWGTIITVDQEGGTVARLRAPLTEWPTPMSFGAAGDPARTEKASTAMNSELAQLGFTLNNGTVADATIGAQDPTIGARSYGEDPELVSEMAKASVDGAKKAGVLSSVKHFPGHGSVTGDSHLGLPSQPASLAQLKARDFKAFQGAIDGGANVVMMGHLDVPALDPGVPTSLSPAAYRQLRSMGFKGVAVTDALNMGAITQSYGPGEAAARALGAGADLLLMPADVDAARSGIVNAVKSGAVSESRLNEAAERVIAMGIWRKRLADKRVPPAEPGSSTELSRKDSVAGTTILTGQCSAPLVKGSSVRLVGGDPADRAAFTAAAKESGLTVGSSGPTVALAGYGSSPMRADVVVATDGPWVLANSTAPAKVALYSATPNSFSALVAVLRGKVKATGKLTTQVGPYKAGTGCSS